MKVLIVAAVCVVVDDDGDPAGATVPNGNPLDDLIDRMRREMQHGRDSVRWREPDGPKVTR